MLKYYIAAQIALWVVWGFAPSGFLPLWAIWLPALTMVLHLGIVVGIAIVGLLLIGILGRQQRKDFNNVRRH